MKNVKKSLALILALTMAVTLIPTHTIAQNKGIAGSKADNTQPCDATQTFKSAVINTPPLALGNEDILINSPSGITYDTKVSYEIITNGKAGITDGETSSAVVRFTLNNPSVQPVSFSYKAISGSADVYYHLTGTTTGIVSLTAEKPQQDVTIEMAAFVDKTIVDMPLPNPPNAFWSGERIFYLYCYDIKNALFDEDRESLTLPILVESEFDYEAAYENAVKSELIDLEQVPDGEDGVYQVPEPVDGIRELRMTGEISGDIRKMIDTGVFTHINLPQGYFINQSDQDQVITYKIKVANNGNGIEVIPVEQGIFINADSQTSFYSEDFTQVRTIEQINLGAEEANTLFNKIDFVFDYSDVTTPDAISTRFFDENDQYLQHQVSFSDNARPKVSSLSIDVENARYGDDIPVTIHFSEPVYTDDISFKVGEQTFHPMESTGTISEAVSFLYRIGDEALDATGFTIDVTEIAGAVDLSGNAQEIPGSGMASVNIFSSLRHAFSYCAEPTIDLDQGTSRNMLATVSINLKADTELSNWLSSGAGSDNITTSVKAKAITNEGAIYIPLTILTDATRVTELTGSFTVPENNTGDDVYYLLEIYMDIGGGFEPVYSLATVYTVQPLIIVDDESDITLNYTHWPAGNTIYVNAGSSLSLDYRLNVKATWLDTEYYRWTSSNESVAKIDENGVITLLGTGQVHFTLTVTNPLSADEFSFNSRALTVLESQDAYLYVPNGIKNQELLIGSDAKISFSSNLVSRNDLYGGTDTKTPFTFTLYEAEYDESGMKKGSMLSTEVIDASVGTPLNLYTVPAQKLTKVTERDKYGYILEISAKDINSEEIKTSQANIRIRQLPAKASLLRPESVFLIDSTNSFTIGFDIGNKTSETEYLLSVTRNSEVAPVNIAASPSDIEPLTISISDVVNDRLLDVYTISLKAKNLSDETWSYDSYCIYVYNTSAMKMLIDGFPALGSHTMDYDFKDGDIIYNISFLQSRAMLGKELIRTLKIDDKSYNWSAIADRVTWKVEGESVSLWYGGRRIGDDYNPILLPGTALLLKGDGAGSSVVTATHTLTGMSEFMNVTLAPINDKLFLFRVYPDVSSELVYTNGNGQQKTITFSGQVGVYEQSGIEGDVAIYPTGESTAIYDFSIIDHNTMMANQKSSSSFDLYPINTVRLPKINYNVSLELFDETSGEPYNGDIIIRGGVYYNGTYKKETTINGKMGNADQIVSADTKGQYRLAFTPSDFTSKLSSSDELSYVIEVNFADSSHIPKYIKVENDVIRTHKGSALGVCLKEGIKVLNAASIQNNAIILSQTLTINGEKQSIYDRIYLQEGIKSAILDIIAVIPQYSTNNYRFLMLNQTGGIDISSSLGEPIYAYPFSNIATLRFKTDLSYQLDHAQVYIKQGDIGYYYPCFRSYDGSREIRLSKPIQMQNLWYIPKMDRLAQTGGYEGDLAKVYLNIWQMCRNSGDVNFTENNDAVKPSLDFLKNYSLDYSSIGLEIQSTDDPLVYRGIIRFAVGSYSKDNPSGVFVGSGEKTSFKFMPGFSDTKAMAKGTFLKKAKEAMYDKGGSFKTYGGGAYIECEVYYDIDEREWKICLLYGDFYLGGGGGFKKNFNSWVGFVPVTSTFKYTMTAEAGLTILHSKAKNTTAYIPRLRPVFSIYGFGGVGFDYTFVAFKAGGYGFVEHEQLYRWYSDNEGLKMDGQQLKISGEVGVEYAIWLAFVKLSGKYVLAKYEKSWEYNDHNEITKKILENAKEREMRFLAPGGLSGSDVSGVMLVPVEESAIFEDRSYLEEYDRFWGSPSSGRRMLTLLSAEELTDIWTGAYPNAAPQLSEDGEIMVYLSDMDSKNISDTAVNFAIKDGTGSFSAIGTEINESDYPDSTPVLAGTKEGASAAWVRTFSDMVGEAGDEATVEDVINGLAASEIMAGIYKEGTFNFKRLTKNDNPDLSPVTASNGDRAITAWRSVTLGDMANPLEFTSDYIMYSVYDGSDWSDSKALYDGSIDGVRALNTAMLPDGTSAVVYQVLEDNGGSADDSEIICAVLNVNGEVVRTLRLTDNIIEDVNPQITIVEFPDEVKRFVIGWNTQTESGESLLQMVAVNADGTRYPDFSLELYDKTGQTDYSSFRFTKGAKKLEDLSVIWSEPAANKGGIYKYIIFGTKVIVSADNIVSASGKHKLLELSEGYTLDTLDSTVDPNTGKVELLMLLTESNGPSAIATSVAEYKNLLTVEEPDYEYEDILPGFEMPVQFTVRNDGVDPITNISIELGERTFEYEEALAPGEEKKYLVSHIVPNPVVNVEYTVTAQFKVSGETGVQTGILKLGLPDAGIYQIDRTEETRRKRGFRILLQNTAFAKLKSGIHTVKLEVWDEVDFEVGSPFKTFILTDENLNILNDSLLSLDITLTEEDLQRLLDENGEIPEGGATIFFRTVVTQGGEVVEDADISNDIAYVNIYSLIEKNGTAVSLASLTETTGEKTTVQVEATNNSMSSIDNGNIIVTLRDEIGNVLETQQTYNFSDSSLLTIPGEEPKTASILFNRTGYTADVAFSRVSEESTLLSVLNLTGIPLEFNPNVFEYSIKVYDLIQTNLTAVAENPSSIISVTKNGFPISISAPISMSYGITIFVITVTTGESNKTYTVTVDNSKIDYGEGPGHGKASDSDSAYEYYADLIIDGIKQSDVRINLRGRQAIVSLGSLAQDIFVRNTETYLEIPTTPNTEGYRLEIPATTLADPYTGAALTVSTELGSVRIPAGMLAGIPHLEGKTAGINISAADRTRLPEDIRAALGNHPLLSLTLTLDGEKVDWNNSDAPVTVCIPYLPTAEELENPESIVIWYIDDNGGAVCVPNGRYDPITGTVIFSTTHFSDFAVAYNKVSFNDVAENAWYSKPVSFIAARGITAGTSKGKYSPEAILTRGEFLVLLMRAYNILPDENPTENFSDGGNGYFTGYLAAAKRLGISVGVGNNMFAPNNEITRQEMFAMLYNALEALNQLPEGGSNRNLSDFTDAELISPWAKKAMTLLVETGTIVGSNGVLNPHGKTTRAQMAQALYNLFSR